MIVTALALAVFSSPSNDEAAAPLNKAIVDFAIGAKGRQVGNGECAILAYEASRAAGAAKMGADSPDEGDYVWGDLIAICRGGSKESTTEVVRDKIRPGDIVQYRDALFETTSGSSIRRMTASHHTSIVSWAGGDGSVWKVYEQKAHNNLSVVENVLPVGGLKSGWLRVYRAMPESASRPAPPK